MHLHHRHVHQNVRHYSACSVSQCMVRFSMLLPSFLNTYVLFHHIIGVYVFGGMLALCTGVIKIVFPLKLNNEQYRKRCLAPVEITPHIYTLTLTHTSNALATNYITHFWWENYNKIYSVLNLIYYNM